MPPSKWFWTPASQAGNCGFESRRHHHSPVSQWSMCLRLNRGERLTTQQGMIWLLSSVVEHPAVNRSGAGSNPAGAAILGYSQVVRQPALTRLFVGSNPATPAICSFTSVSPVRIRLGVPHRGVAQLAEQRSPKPKVGCSIRLTPATCLGSSAGRAPAF